MNGTKKLMILRHELGDIVLPEAGVPLSKSFRNSDRERRLIVSMEEFLLSTA